MDLINAKNYILERTLKLAEKVGDRLPVKTINGEYVYTDNCGWTGGFWVGMLNYCYLLSGDKKYLEIAEKSRFRFLDRIYKTPETLDHDVGFKFIPSEYARYKISGKEESLKTVLDAANIFMKRYNEKGKFLRAWNLWPGTEFGANNPGRIIIDCMYNLPILFLASEHTGDKKYYNAAVNHANTCMDTIVRSDGTTYHTYVINPETGEHRFGETAQGYSDESCWARGQSWAIGGYAMAYKYTKDEKYLEVSKKTAEKFIELLDDTFLPRWDLVFKNRKDMPYDASAAAIAASGLIELSNQCNGTDLKTKFEKSRYLFCAKKLLEALWNICLIKNDDHRDGMITYCVGSFKAYDETDENFIFADYYFVEGISRLLGIETFC